MTPNLAHASNSPAICRVRLTISPPLPRFRPTAEDFLSALHHELLNRFGGSCRGLCSDGDAVAEVRGPALELVKQYVGSFVSSLSRRHPHLQINLQIDASPRRVFAPQTGIIHSSPTSSPLKLSKVFFMGLNDGVFVASNVFSNDGQPSFAAHVVPRGQRETQWSLVRSARADQRLCRVFDSGIAYQTWLKGMTTYFSQPGSAPEANTPAFGHSA